MSARHAAPEKDRFGAVLTAGRVGLQVVAVGLLGLAVALQQQTIEPREDRAATVPDVEPRSR
ncbi:hypothetical protein ACIOJE_07240 [Kitasatospora sp. NPDC087861]|uniref:hypothetical protein n=1 Tax=Kitasatospora sp. NPDC087861 TaxID=3364070 RepID=UPI00381C56D8